MAFDKRKTSGAEPLRRLTLTTTARSMYLRTSFTAVPGQHAPSSAGHYGLAVTGYYNGEDLLRCKKNKIVTIVARQKVGREAPDKGYNADKFTYVENKDCYICPLGQVLKRTGTKESRVYQNKKACEGCLERAKCTTGAFKRLSISHYQKVFTATDKCLAENLQLYRRRQMIVEHPLGTIKRSMNGYYFLLRTIKKVRGEVALLFFAYNLKRVQNILDQKELMKRLAALLYSALLWQGKNGRQSALVGQ